MTTSAKYLCLTLVSGLAVLATAGPAAAQYRYYCGGAPCYGSGPYVGNYDPYGGYLNGAGSVISSMGQYYINTQQAYLLKEQVRAAQMENHRKAFDEWLYERNAMPTLNDEIQRTQQQELRRARMGAGEPEIWAGTSLNVLLADIQQMSARGYSGPVIPLNEDTLRQINVTVTGRGNAGQLKEAQLQWPYGLQTLPPDAEAKGLREQVDKLMIEAKQQAAGGRVNGMTTSDLTKAIARLRQLLLPQVNVLSFSDYTESKKFLSQLDDAVTTLKSPNASKYVNGTYAAKGNTVQELVQYMTNNGLTFAPAVTGEEGAYNALYQAMVSYDVRANAMATPAPSSMYKKE
jgi:hypothetical protein